MSLESKIVNKIISLLKEEKNWTISGDMCHIKHELIHPDNIIIVADSIESTLLTVFNYVMPLGLWSKIRLYVAVCQLKVKKKHIKQLEIIQRLNEKTR